MLTVVLMALLAWIVVSVPVGLAVGALLRRTREANAVRPARVAVVHVEQHSAPRAS